MKVYKPLFKESNNIVKNENEAMQIVNVSHLFWLPKRSVKEKTYIKAISSAGTLRLPTIQEIYSTYIKTENLKMRYEFEWGFHWTSSTDPNGNIWIFKYPEGVAELVKPSRSQKYFATYVQDV
jgi:hypothetical protein